MKHAINWFEIPASDFNRARKFYETVLDVVMQIPFEGMKYAMFPVDMEKGACGGGLVEDLEQKKRFKIFGSGKNSSCVKDWREQTEFKSGFVKIKGM